MGYGEGRRRNASHSALPWLRLHFVSERSEPGASESDSCCISDAGLTAVADGFGKLEKLSLIWCSNARSAGHRSVAEKCRFLKSLDLHLSLLLPDGWTSPTSM
ncbi:hypothetical protein CTI12_AA610940 [Artemisia annua]|uniref:Uncharacterized protein n=1 Tax=Artemisia annua TaxID=35608 RepID=A0A2U1KCE2_ARTAN|nr:hypothetical protein CTI12_AA610940 [Artemisia annua]